MIPLQLFGVVIALAALHLSYLYYKRSDFTKRELLIWLTIWIAFLLVTIFPRIVEPVVGKLGLQRPMDLIMIIAFIVLFGVAFRTYVITARQGRKLEKLIRNLALKDLPTKHSDNK